MSNYAKSALRSPDFKPTSGVTTKVAVLKGMLFSGKERVTKKIRAEAQLRFLVKPNAEIACLIREKFTNEEIKAMGLWWIVTMHDPINDSDGDPRLLSVFRLDDCWWWLDAYFGNPDLVWRCEDGFAFAVS